MHRGGETWILEIKLERQLLAGEQRGGAEDAAPLGEAHKAKLSP